jgi:hypothetical protein
LLPFVVLVVLPIPAVSCLGEDVVVVVEILDGSLPPPPRPPGRGDEGTEEEEEVLSRKTGVEGKVPVESGVRIIGVVDADVVEPVSDVLAMIVSVGFDGLIV